MKKILRFIYYYWLKFAHFMGEINSKIILTLFFIFFVGLYALIIKLIMLTKTKADSTNIDTNWQNKKYNGAEMETLKRQF